MKKVWIFFSFVAVISIAQGQPVQEVYSPDHLIKVEFAIDHGVKDAPFYQVRYRGKIFLLPSALGFQIAGQPTFRSFFSVADSRVSEHRGSWRPLYGERDHYPDNYNQLEVTLKEQIPPGRSIKVIFRAYDEGIAFRYEFPDQPMMQQFSIVKELTEFRFTPGTDAWEEYGHEGLYHKVSVDSIKPDCELPLTVVTPDTIYAAIAEGGSSDYPRAYVQRSDNRRALDVLTISLRGEAKGGSGYVSNWRMITLGDRPGDLMERDYLLLNLNKPDVIADGSWIKPGKAIRDNTLSTLNGKRLIDYAQRHAIDYVILDWGWYGPPNGEDTDPSKVDVVNPGTGKPIPGHTGLDMAELVTYGRSKGIGIFLYVNRQGMERYMDKIFMVYESWDIKGIKPGFVNVGNQEWQRWVDTLVRKAAEHHLMVDIHDAYRPTGLSRTYPNLLTQEGVRGNEHTPDADHNTKLPFVRYTIGAADYTPGYCRLGLLNTWVHRLALPVLFYSPGQFLFWNESLSECHERPELAFWRDIPVTWDDTKVLEGAIGEYAVVARRKGDNWYVGGITNHEGRTLSVKMDFLKLKDPGTGKELTYEATIYTDDKEARNVLIERKTVDINKVLSFPLQASGGFALEIRAK